MADSQTILVHIVLEFYLQLCSMSLLEKMMTIPFYAVLINTKR